MLLFLILSLSFTGKGIDCKAFDRIAINQKPDAEPYEVVELERFPDQRCFSICHYGALCVALLIEKVDNLQYRCHLYKQTIYYLALTPSAPSTETVFHSMRVYRDCLDLYKAGVRVTGVYQINIDNFGPTKVRCNMDVDGGGWTVFEHRFDGSVDFIDRDWVDYKNGFGSPDGELWLGNEALHSLTTSSVHDFYIHAGTFPGSSLPSSQHSKYDGFIVANQADDYRMNANSKVSGIESIKHNRGMRFTTRDRDNDAHGVDNCATRIPRGGFWYHNCGHLFFQGQYYGQESCENLQGIHWRFYYTATGTQCLKWVEMMVRRQVNI
ncbi:ficolin-1-like [Clytia hemisphaerica]|uniref:ficolin-1-like n=1 Tax=Clytia hemisphaerica TaxID=252671 RepID=UPI0034D49B1F